MNKSKESMDLMHAITALEELASNHPNIAMHVLLESPEESYAASVMHNQTAEKKSKFNGDMEVVALASLTDNLAMLLAEIGVVNADQRVSNMMMDFVDDINKARADKCMCGKCGKDSDAFTQTKTPS